jgi:hypothetical protein
MVSIKVSKNVCTLSSSAEFLASIEGAHFAQTRIISSVTALCWELVLPYAAQTEAVHHDQL